MNNFQAKYTDCIEMNVKHENVLSMFYSEKNRNCCSKHKRLFFIAGDIIQYFNCSNILNGLRLRLRCCCRCRRRFAKVAAASCQWISTSECETETKSTTYVKNFNRFSTCVCLFVLLIFFFKIASMTSSSRSGSKMNSSHGQRNILKWFSHLIL